MPHITLNGWKIHYEEAGQGPPILLVHGILMDRTMFEAQAASLRDRYRVITPDLRGHGESEKRAEDHTQWDMMEDHLALCDHLGNERAVFGGQSQGGFQSLRLALKYPERLAGLILIDTQAGMEDEVRAPMYEAMAEVVASDGWNETLLESVAMTMFGDSASPAVRQHWIKRWEAQPTHAARESLFAVTRREDVTPRLSEITAPAIVIHGEEDVAINMESAEELAQRLPNLVEFVKIPRAGHCAPVEQPEAVTEAIERFLEKVYPA